jgi:hypothetical protein
MAEGLPGTCGTAELLKDPSGHAIIHDKIVVIEPFSPNPAVITGSHNLGYRASYMNDENRLIFQGNRRVAEAYAAHVLEIYDHYRFRFQVQNHGAKAWSGLATTPDWHDLYFASGSPALKEVAFWESGIGIGIGTGPTTAIATDAAGDGHRLDQDIDGHAPMTRTTKGRGSRKKSRL